MLGASISLVVFLAVLISIHVLVGVYVYRDARSRGMNEALWTLVVVLAPALIGFIIYLLVRGSYSDMKCSKCGTSVSEQFLACPNCGEKLKATCPRCSAPVEPEWKVCPRCAAVLPEQYDEISTPVKKQDKALRKILLAVILIPIVLIAVAFFPISAFSSSGGTGITSLPSDEYMQEINNPQIEKWLGDTGSERDKAYVLRHESTQGEQIRVRYLIYMPCLAERPQISIEQRPGLFGRVLGLKIAGNGENAGNTLLLVTYTGENAPKLEVSYGGSRLECEITDVDYPLGLTDAVDKKKTESTYHDG